MIKLKCLIFIIIITLILVFGLWIAKGNSQELIDTEITFGQESVFNTASTSGNVIVGLSKSKFVVAYIDGGGNFNKGTAIVGDVSGNNISFGSEYVFNNTATNYISMAPLSETRFIAVYRDVGNLNYGTAIIGNVSGDEITFGNEYVFSTSNVGYVSVVILSLNKFALVYKDINNLSYGTAIIGNVSGDEITFGNEYVFNTALSDYISVASLSESKLAIAYRDGGSYGYGTAIIGNVSGDEISFGSKYIFKSSNTDNISLDSFSGDKFVIAYRGADSYFNYGMAVIGNVSGDEISFGSEYVFDASATNYISGAALSSDRMAIVYKDMGSLGQGTAVIGNVSGDEISFGSEYVFNITNTKHSFIEVLSEDSFAAAYQVRDGGTNYGTAIVGSVPTSLSVVEEEISGSESEENIKEEEAAVGGLADGDLVRNPNAEGMAQFDIYIIKLINNKKFKRLILSPHVFESYSHFDKNSNGSPWDDVIDVSQATLDEYTISNLVRADGDTKVYELTADGDSGVKRLLNMSVVEFAALYDSDSIYTINNTDRDAHADVY